MGGHFFFFSSRRRHTRLQGDWSSDVCSSDLSPVAAAAAGDQDLVASGGSFHPVAEPVAELVGANDYFACRGSGARGTRTPDLSAASRTLSQLSYSPESVVVCKVNAGALAVPWWLEPQVQLPLARD